MEDHKFEDYRQPWETGDHWELKREFIERYKDTYPIDKLLCLAQAYSNIELLHCSYPIKVMKEIHELSKPLKACKVFRERSGLSFSNPNGATTPASRGKRKGHVQDSGGKMKFIKFCSASEASKINENSTETRQPAEQDFNLESKQPAEQDFNLETKQPTEQDLGISSRIEVGCCTKDQPANPVIQNKADVQHASRANNVETILAKMKKFAQAVRNQKVLRQTDWTAIHNASAITKMELKYDIQKVVRRQTNSRIVHRFNCKLYIAGILVSVAELAGRKKAQVKATGQAVQTLLDSSNEYAELLKLIENFSKSDSLDSSFSVSEISGTSEKISTDVIDVKQNNESLSPLNSPNSEIKQVSDVETNPLYEVDIEKTKLQLEKEFGLDFMQQLASEIRHALETDVHNAIATAARVLKIDRLISFKFDVIKSSSSLIFICTVFMKNIVVGIGKGPSKKCAKKLAASLAFAHLLNSKVWLGDMYDSGISSKATLNSSDVNATTFDSAIEKKVSDHKKYVLLSSHNCKENPYQYLNRLSENSETCSITENDIKSIFALIQNLAKYVNFPSMHAISNASQKAKISNDIVYNVVINEDTTVTSKAYLCEILFKNIIISSGIGRTKVKSKYSAADAAVEKLNNLKNFIFVEYNKKPSSLSSSSENCSLSGITPTFKLNRSLLDSTLQRQFVIMDNSEAVTVSQRSAGSILQHSAGVCQKSIVNQHSECIPNDGSLEVLHRFDVILDGIVVGTGICNVKAEAKRRASADALANLKKVVYTIKVKDVQNKDDIVIRREQLINSEYGSGALTDTNIGCKMLKSMGWTGGGIGKTSGIVEPIMADKATFRNQGIGYSKKDNSLFNFRKKIQALLQDFKKSNSFNDLIFSKDFSKQERKEIHGQASRLHLNSNSYGVEKFRQLFIRNKYTPLQLLDHLIKNGGSTNKYNLLDLSTEE